MPKIKSAIKKMHQSEKKAVANRKVKNELKSLLDSYKKKPTDKGLTDVSSALDKAAKKNILHANKAARLKSRMAKLLKPKKAPKS